MRYIQIFGFSLMIQVYILSWNIPDVTAQLLNIDLETIAKWAKLWFVSFNPSKSESLLISRKVNAPIHPPIFMHNQQLTEVTCHKHLGLHISVYKTVHGTNKYIKEKAWLSPILTVPM